MLSTEANSMNEVDANDVAIVADSPCIAPFIAASTATDLLCQLPRIAKL